MLQNSFAVLLLIFIFSLDNTNFCTALSGRGPLCLSCNKVVQPRDCNHVTACGEHEKCYVQREITDSGIAWYSVGCSDAQRCAVPIGIGKRQRNDKENTNSLNSMNSSSDANHISEDSVIVCTSCCTDGDLCNRKGCGSPERLPIEGMLCYNCDQQAAPDMCDDITLCGPDKNCYIEQMQFGSDNLFSTKCIQKTACTISSSKARCCDTELCNDHFLDNSTTHFTKQSTNFVSTTTSTTTQTSPSLTTTTGMRCPYQWHYHESSKYCYLENEGTMTLDEARETCKRYGQHLPIIENLNEQDFIKSIMEPMHVTIWLDGTDITNEGKWVWYTTGQPIGYFNWSPGQPDHYFGVHRENCMDYGPEYNMQWNDAPCHNILRKHNVLCEGGVQTTVPTCSSNWIHKDHYMYCVMNFTGNWYTAQKMCSSLSAHLPVADTAEAFKRIGDVTGRSNDIWLDGTDEHHPDLWKWQSTGLEFGYQPWTPGEPNDGTEHCLEVVARTEWRWNDGHCEQTGRVNKLVCERYELTAQNVIG